MHLLGRQRSGDDPGVVRFHSRGAQTRHSRRGHSGSLMFHPDPGEFRKAAFGLFSPSAFGRLPTLSSQRSLSLSLSINKHVKSNMSKPMGQKNFLAPTTGSHAQCRFFFGSPIHSCRSAGAAPEGGGADLRGGAAESERVASSQREAIKPRRSEEVDVLQRQWNIERYMMFNYICNIFLIVVFSCFSHVFMCSTKGHKYGAVGNGHFQAQFFVCLV